MLYIYFVFTLEVKINFSLSIQMYIALNSRKYNLQKVNNVSSTKKILESTLVQIY